MNPKKLNAMMRQMGIEVEDIDDVEEVIIRTADRELRFTNAAVSKMTAQGTITWQLTGDVNETSRAPAGPQFTQEDIDLVAEQANVSKEKARAALEAADGQPAEALLKLMGEE